MDEMQYEDKQTGLTKKQKIIIGVGVGVTVLYTVGYVRHLRRDVDDLAKAMSYIMRTQDFILHR